MKLKVLIITVSYSAKDSSIPRIDNIDANRDGLMLLFNELNPKSIHNPQLADFGLELSSFLREATNNDTLLVYYSGHGFQDQDYNVYLETNDSMSNGIAKSSYFIKEFVNDIQDSAAGRKIIIIDSCYSGAAHPHHNTMDLGNDCFLKEYFEKSKDDYKGVYILTSTKPYEIARYPKENPDKPTFFTGELLYIFNHGLSNRRKKNITCNDLYVELQKRLKSKNLPEPYQSNDGDVLKINIMPNKSYLNKPHQKDIAKKIKNETNSTKSNKETTNKTYTISYEIDNEVIEKLNLSIGSEINLIDAPQKGGYTFIGWQCKYKSMPAHNIVVIGTYQINSYKVTYKIDGNVYYTDNIQYNTEFTLIDAPKKEGYTFSGWQCKYKTMPAYDIIVSGSYKKNFNWKRIMLFVAGLLAIAAIGLYLICPPNGSREPIYNGTTLEKVFPEEQGVNGVFTVREGTKKIAAHCFKNCHDLKEIVLPSTIDTIERRLFEECVNLENIKLPEHIVYIGEGAFMNCKKLKILNIPLSVNSIDINPFCGCNELRIIVPQNHEFFYEHDGYLINKKTNTLVSYTGKQENIVIPSDIGIIGESAFALNKYVKTVDMIETYIVEIRSFAFSDCNNIQSIALPKSLDRLGKCNPFIGIHFKNSERHEINSNYVNDYGYLIDTRNKTLISYLGNDSEINFYRMLNRIDSIGEYSFANCNFIKSFNKECYRPKKAKNAFFKCNNDIINQFNNL